MPRIHVCSLPKLHDTVRETGARDILTLINAGTPLARPTAIAEDRHLILHVSDIVARQDGQILAGEAHLVSLLDFVGRWSREEPLVIHCFAGVSRSTASAFIGACMLRPEKSEAYWADAIREVSPTATPNAHLVALADRALDRRGRMIAAIEAIGRGEDCAEGVPFFLDIGKSLDVSGSLDPRKSAGIRG
jgi:predicted protein tyrosine phosphatase